MKNIFFTFFMLVIFNLPSHADFKPLEEEVVLLRTQLSSSSSINKADLEKFVAIENEELTSNNILDTKDDINYKKTNIEQEPVKNDIENDKKESGDLKKPESDS